MRERFDHLTILLYTGAVILFCLLIVSIRSAKDKVQKSLPDTYVIPAVTSTVPETGTLNTAEPYTAHKPEVNVRHKYSFTAVEAEKVECGAGMLSIEEIRSSRYYRRPDGSAEHVFREENGVYDCFVYGAGSVGGMDAYAKYVFRYDPALGKAVSFIQEQHIGTGVDLSESSLSLYAAATGYLLDAVFSGTGINTDNDRRKIEELALYFFSSYIPAHPVIPAVIHFRMPAYMLTFVMDSDVFITLISPDRIPGEYRVENEMD